MKITALKLHVLKSRLAEPFAFSQGWVRQRSATLVELLTDERLVGWDEALPRGWRRRRSPPRPSNMR